eukprot:scaffold34651_cov152-Isochrysis_galbana.AAC.4
MGARNMPAGEASQMAMEEGALRYDLERAKRKRNAPAFSPPCPLPRSFQEACYASQTNAKRPEARDHQRIITCRCGALMWCRMCVLRAALRQRVLAEARARGLPLLRCQAPRDVAEAPLPPPGLLDSAQHARPTRRASPRRCDNGRGRVSEPPGRKSDLAPSIMEWPCRHSAKRIVADLHVSGCRRGGAYPTWRRPSP